MTCCHKCMITYGTILYGMGMLLHHRYQVLRTYYIQYNSTSYYLVRIMVPWYDSPGTIICPRVSRRKRSRVFLFSASVRRDRLLTAITRCRYIYVYIRSTWYRSGSKYKSRYRYAVCTMHRSAEISFACRYFLG